LLPSTTVVQGYVYYQDNPNVSLLLFVCLI